MLEWRNCSTVAGKPESADYFWGNGNDFASLVGSVVRKPLASGALVPVRDVIKPGDADFLSAVLKPGTRAVAIRVDDVTGGAGLIRPGNMVDVLVSGKFNYQAAGAGEVATAKTLLKAVRVLAVNRDVVLQEQNSVADAAKYAPTRETRGTITLEVSPKEVELLTVAKTMGTLSLSLCSLDDQMDATTASFAGQTLGTEIVAPNQTGGPGEAAAASPKAVVTMYGTDQSRRVTN
jgi:pilus assembly protein CpaB